MSLRFSTRRECGHKLLNDSQPSHEVDSTTLPLMISSFLDVRNVGMGLVLLGPNFSLPDGSLNCLMCSLKDLKDINCAS